MASSVKEFVNLAITITQHFTKPNAPPMKAPQRFQTLLSGLSQKSIDEIQNAIPALSGLAELAFKPDFNPSSTVINDIILPSLVGYTDTLKSLIQQLIQTMKKFGEIFSSSNKDSKSSEQINGLSALTYQPNVIFNILTLLNTSLIQFCQIIPILESKSNLPQLILQRIILLSQMTKSVETCQVYLEIHRNSQHQSSSLPPILPSIALSSFKSAILPSILNPSNSKIKNKIYEELNQCIIHQQNIIMIVSFGEKPSDKKEIEVKKEDNKINKSPNTEQNKTKNEETNKETKKSTFEQTSTENKSQSNKIKDNNINEEQTTPYKLHSSYKIIRTASGGRVPLGTLSDPEGYDLWKERVDKLGFHKQTHPDKIDSEMLQYTSPDKQSKKGSLRRNEMMNENNKQDNGNEKGIHRNVIQEDNEGKNINKD
ncbi:MAG: hypothetical protein EZS28_004668 [Streblomastix strix]|uniref:Uncharacterized protein n=1 Tax=Streblomastix strix TaxID=222440 RepID=A0A5J4WZB0_9EUKA|nr:MAG: hypothetical protein EZS28_004668 [Streblomastix strix]